MKVAICSNIDNAKGLERDYRLLRGLLEGMGHEVRGLHFERDARHPPKNSADLLIFLEVCRPVFFDVAPRRWLAPNPEWWNAEDNHHLGAFEAVLCKTRDARRLFAPLVGDRAVLTGFLSEDRHLPGQRARREFLHTPGGSIVKGTKAVLEAWHRYGIKHRLTVVSTLRPPAPRTSYVAWATRLPDVPYRRHQNGHAFHLCPSEYEGWGHHLHEGLSVGACVVTTDAPPMNDVDGVALTIPAAEHGAQRLATTARVSPEGVREAVERCLALSDVELARIGEQARAAFHDQRDGFVAALETLL